jgi:hypothetical protein
MSVGRGKAPIQLHITPTNPALLTRLLTRNGTISDHRALLKRNRGKPCKTVDA